MASISSALIATVIGAPLYFPFGNWVKPDVPDVDYFAVPEAAG